MIAIKKSKIEELKKELQKHHEVFDARNKILPFKQYFLPGKEKLFTFDKKRRKAKTAAVPKPFIIFGLDLRDTEALVQLDEIMKKKEEDFFYFQKRKVATIISIIEESENLPHTGIDLVLERLNDKVYKAHPLSEKGKKITKSKLFHKEPTPGVGSQTDIVNRSAPMPKLRGLLKDPELLKDAVEWSWKNYPQKWDELAKKCLGCGICTYVCPLCYCFSVEDRCLLDNKTCIKQRTWTACTLPEFSKITGGHNFHPSLKERYYNWFYHKFVRGYKEFGKSQCVACGRCKAQCRASIDIEKELLDIVTNYKSSVDKK